MQYHILLFLWAEASFFSLGLCKIPVLNGFSLHSPWREHQMGEVPPKALTWGFFESIGIELGHL